MLIISILLGCLVVLNIAMIFALLEIDRKATCASHLYRDYDRDKLMFFPSLFAAYRCRLGEQDNKEVKVD